MKNIGAVVTGDVRNSYRDFKDQQELLLKRLHSIYDYVQKYFSDEMVYNIDIFRGDSFQFFISDPRKALKIAICFYLYAKYLQIDLKIGVGIGRYDYLNKAKISESNGQAFLLSGQALEKLDKKSSIEIALPKNSKLNYVVAYITLLNIYLEALSAKNSLAVFGKLVNLNQTEITKIWDADISRQAISKHWQKVKVDKFVKSLGEFTNFLNQLIGKMANSV